MTKRRHINLDGSTRDDRRALKKWRRWVRHRLVRIAGAHDRYSKFIRYGGYYGSYDIYLFGQAEQTGASIPRSLREFAKSALMELSAERAATFGRGAR